MIQILSCIVIVFIFFIFYGYLQNFCLKVEYYSIVSAAVSRDVRIVLLADLHGNQFGRDNQKLVQRIHECEPDFICVAGDLTVKDGKHTARMLSLLERLSDSYEIYYSPGNHEIRMPDYPEYVAKIKAMGIHYLANESAVRQDGCIMTGLDLPMYWYRNRWRKRNRPLRPKRVRRYVKKRPDRGFHILLAHNPEFFDAYAGWGADLTLSGHVHGGIMRLPVLGGVIAPSLRLFPKYDAGEFRLNNSEMIVSRGLGTHHIKLRFFNPPELSLIEVKKE